MASESKLTGYCSQYQMAVLFYNYKSVNKVVSVWPKNLEVSLILLVLAIYLTRSPKDAQNAVIRLFPELAKCNFTIKSGDFPLGDEQEWIEFKKHVDAYEIPWTKDIVTITISQ